MIVVGSTEMALGYHPQREFRPSIPQSLLLPLEINRQPQTRLASPPSNQYTESALFPQTNINVPSSVASRAKYAAFTQNGQRQPQSVSGNFRGHLMQHHQSTNAVMGANLPQLNYATSNTNNNLDITNRLKAFMAEPQRFYGPPAASSTQSPLETFDRLKQNDFHHQVPSRQYLPVFEPTEFGKTTTTTERSPPIDVRHGNLNANVVIQKAQVQKLESQIETRNRNEFRGNDENAATKYSPPTSTEKSVPSTTRVPITTTSAKPAVEDDENVENVPNFAIATAISGNLYLIQPNGRLQKLRIVQSDLNTNGFEEERSFMNNQLVNVLYATPFYNLYSLGKR